MLRRLFHYNRLLARSWSADEVEALQAAFHELGPSWDLIADRVTNRSPYECRWKYGSLNPPSHISNATEMEAHLQGLERHGSTWIDVPVEGKGSRIAPHLKLLEDVPYVRTRSEQKRAGWHPAEDLVIREAFNYYGPNWEFIAEKFRFRTPIQCKHRMLKLYRAFNVAAMEQEKSK